MESTTIQPSAIKLGPVIFVPRPTIGPTDSMDKMENTVVKESTTPFFVNTTTTTTSKPFFQTSTTMAPNDSGITEQQKWMIGGLATVCVLSMSVAAYQQFKK
jgi:hypothetical protein